MLRTFSRRNYSLIRRHFLHSDQLKKAELEVGYAASFLGLKYIISEEFSTIATYVRQIVQTKHPLLGAIRNLLAPNKDSETPTPSLLILLLCKIAREMENVDFDCSSKSHLVESGIHQCQRDIAELAEMMFVGFSIHSTIQDFKRGTADYHAKDLVTGNKLAVLVGDFILAKVSKGAADSDSADVVSEVSKAVVEASEGNYLKRQLESKEPHAHIKCSISLSEESLQKIQNLRVVYPFARFVKSALIVTGHSQEAIERVSNLSKTMIRCFENIRELNEYRNLQKSEVSTLSGSLSWSLPEYLSNAGHSRPQIEDIIEAKCRKQIEFTCQALSTFPNCSSRSIMYELVDSYRE